MEIKHRLSRETKLRAAIVVTHVSEIRTLHKYREPEDRSVQLVTRYNQMSWEVSN